MDPHLLRTFVAVSRCGSFSAAARELGYTQSAVSQHIAALEAELHTALLHRRPVTPTGPGQRLLEHADPILLRLAAARADVARAAGEPAGRVLLGATPLSVRPGVAAALARLRRARPGLQVALRVLARATVAAGVATGELDLGLVDGVAAPGDPLRLPDAGWLTAVMLSEDPLVVALPTGHPLASRTSLRLADLASAGWIDAPDLAAPLAELREVTETDGIHASFRYDGTDTAALLALATAGHGLSLLPASALHTTPDLVGIPIAAPRIVHRTEVIHGTVTAAAGTLTDLLISGG